MPYKINLPHSVTLRPSGPALYSPPPRRIKRLTLGYIMDAPGLRMTTGDPGLDNLIKYGFWFGVAALLYKAYGMLRYNEPLFSAGTPPAWKMNPVPGKRTRWGHGENWKEYINKAREEIISTYRPGDSVTSLANAYGLDVKTVIGWLRDAGICHEEPALEEALLLYEPGDNVAELSWELGVPYTQLINFLKKKKVYVSREQIRKLEQKWRASEILGSEEVMDEILRAAYSGGAVVSDLAHQFNTSDDAMEEILKRSNIQIGRFGVIHPTHPRSQEKIRSKIIGRVRARKSAMTRRRRRR